MSKEDEKEIRRLMFWACERLDEIGPCPCPDDPEPESEPEPDWGPLPDQYNPAKDKNLQDLLGGDHAI